MSQAPERTSEDVLARVWRWVLPAVAGCLAFVLLISVSTWLDGAPFVPLLVVFLLLGAGLAVFPLALVTVHVVDRRERSRTGRQRSVWSNGMVGAGRLMGSLPRPVVALAVLVGVVFALTPT